VPVYPVRLNDFNNAESTLTTKEPEVAVATTSSALAGTAPSAQAAVSFQFPPAFDMVLVAVNLVN
jgi:hypothetical protein